MLITKEAAIARLKMGEILRKWGSGSYVRYEISGYTLRPSTAEGFIESHLVELDQHSASFLVERYKWVGGS